MKGLLLAFVILVIISQLKAAKVCDDAGYSSSCVCGSSTPDNECQEVWFACTQTGSANLGGLGILFGLSNGGTAGQNWRVGTDAYGNVNDPNSATCSWAPGGSTKLVTGLFVSGNSRAPVSDRFPVGTGMIACTLDGVFRLSDSDLNQGAPGTAGQTALVGARWTRFLNGARVKGQSGWTQGTLGANEYSQVSNLPRPTGSKTLQPTGALSGAGITVNCIAATYDPCGECPNGGIKLSTGCCPANQVDWSDTPPSCCQGGSGTYIVQWQNGQGTTCCPDSSYVLKKDNTCCKSSQYTGAATDKCCTGTQIVINGASCCDPNLANDKRTACCTGNGAPFHATKDNQCCADADFVANDQDCCDDPSTKVTNADQRTVCCPSGSVQTISGKGTYCCPPSQLGGSGNIYWDTSLNRCCRTGQQNDKGYCCDGQGTGPWKAVTSNPAGVNSNCCPADQVVTGGGNVICCKSNVVDPTYTDAAQAANGLSANERQLCCPAANVMTWNSKKYCCATPTPGGSWFNNACCPSGRLSTDPSGNAKACCSNSDWKWTDKDPCCDQSDNQATENHSCCPKSQVKNIDGKNYCCFFTPSSSVTYKWVSGRCCDARIVSQPTSGGNVVCCSGFTLPNGAYFTNVDVTSGNYNEDDCCPNIYINSGVPSGVKRRRCCDATDRVWTNYQDILWGGTTSGYYAECCPENNVLTIGGTKYCCKNDISANPSAWGWTGSTCCLNSRTTNDGTNKYCCNIDNVEWTGNGETSNNRCCPKANVVQPQGQGKFCCANDADGPYYGNEAPVVIEGKCCPVSYANNDYTKCCISPYVGALPSGNSGWEHVDYSASGYPTFCCPNTFISTLGSPAKRVCCPGQVPNAYAPTDAGEGSDAQDACCPINKILNQAGLKYCCSSTWPVSNKPPTNNDLQWVNGACCDAKTVVTGLKGDKYCCKTTSTQQPPFQATVNEPCCEVSSVTNPVPNPNSGPYCCDDEVEKGVEYTLTGTSQVNGYTKGTCCPKDQKNVDGSACCLRPISDFAPSGTFEKVPPTQYFGTDGVTSWQCCPNNNLNQLAPNASQSACCPGANYQWVQQRDASLALSYQYCCPASNVLSPGGGKRYCCAGNSNGQSWIDNGKGGGSCCPTANIVTAPSGQQYCCSAPGFTWASNNAPCCDPAKISSFFGKTDPYCCPSTSNAKTTNDPCCPPANSNGAAQPYCCTGPNLKETTVDNNKCCPAAKVVNTGTGTACCQAFQNPIWVAGACCEAANANIDKSACCPKPGNYTAATDNKCCQTSHIQADRTCCPDAQFNPSTQGCCPNDTVAVGTGPLKIQPIQCCPASAISKQGTCCNVANYGTGFSLDNQKNCCPTAQQLNGTCCDASVQDATGKCCEAGWPRDKVNVCCPKEQIDCAGDCLESEPFPKTNDSLGVCCNTTDVLCGLCCTNASDPAKCPNQKDINGACCPVDAIDAHNVCYGPDPNGCNGAISCEECISQQQGCGWCGTIGPDADATACYSGDVFDPVKVSNKTCTGSQGYKWSYIQHKSEITNQTGYFDKEPNRTTVPFFTQVVLAKQDDITVHFQVKVPAVTKMDMFWLQDLSNSYGDDLPVIQGLIKQFVNNVTQLLPDTNFAFSSFVDKPIPPFGVAGLDYVYKNWQKLTPGGQPLINLFQNLKAGDVLFGTDVPESALDAMITAALAAGNGWRKSEIDNILHVILLTTDAPSHETCPVGSPYTPNVTMCDNVAVTIAEDLYPVLKVNGSWLPNKGDGSIPYWTRNPQGEEYGEQQGLLLDYPTRKQMFDALNAGGLNIVPIMCVADTLQVGGIGLITENGVQISNTTARDYWNSIQRDLGRGIVVPLSTSSDNLIDAVQDAIKQLTKVVSLALQGGNGTQFIVNQVVLPPQYAGVEPGQILDFNITLIWDGDVSLGNGPFPIDLLAIFTESKQAVTPQFADAHVDIYLGYGQECAKCLDYQWSPATEQCDPTSPEWLNNPCCNNRCEIRSEEDCTGENLCLPAICNASGVCNTEIITCETDNRTCGFNTCQPNVGKCKWQCSTARCCDDGDVCTKDTCEGGICYHQFIDDCACANHTDSCDCLNTNQYLDQNTTLFVKCAFLKGEGCINETAAPDFGYCGPNYTDKTGQKGQQSSSGKDCKELNLVTNASLCAPAKGSAISTGVIVGVSVGAFVVAAIALAVAGVFIGRAIAAKGAAPPVSAGGNAPMGHSGLNPLFTDPNIASTNALFSG